jgi:hypothetical protein
LSALLQHVELSGTEVFPSDDMHLISRVTTPAPHVTEHFPQSPLPQPKAIVHACCASGCERVSQYVAASTGTPSERMHGTSRFTIPLPLHETEQADQLPGCHA